MPRRKCACVLKPWSPEVLRRKAYETLVVPKQRSWQRGRKKTTVTPTLDRRSEQNRFLKGRLATNISPKLRGNPTAPNSNQTPLNISLGVKGPMGCPLVLGVVLRERSTERSEDLPAPPTAPGAQHAGEPTKERLCHYEPNTLELSPGLSRPLTSALLYKVWADKDRPATQTPKPHKHTHTHTHCQENKAVSKGGRRGRARTVPPQPFKSLVMCGFAIRIGNCNRTKSRDLEHLVLGGLPSDHDNHDFPKSTAIQMGGVLQYKWEPYRDTNGRSTDSSSLSSEPRGAESTSIQNWRRIAIQIGGVLRYFFEK